jgi:hypothetical protein
LEARKSDEIKRGKVSYDLRIGPKREKRWNDGMVECQAKRDEGAREQGRGERIARQREHVQNTMECERLQGNKRE